MWKATVGAEQRFCPQQRMDGRVGGDAILGLFACCPFGALWCWQLTYLRNLYKIIQSLRLCDSAFQLTEITISLYVYLSICLYFYLSV